MHIHINVDALLLEIFFSPSSPLVLLYTLINVLMYN